MKYCHQTTTSHSLSARYPQYLEAINKIISNETTAENLLKINAPFNNEVALKLDKVKAEDENVKDFKSMDIALGMNNGEKKMLLVDLKLNCNGAKSLSQNDCTNKIRGSKIILFGGGIPVHNTYIYVFNNQYLAKAEARHDISRKLSNRSVEVLSIDELNERYF